MALTETWLKANNRKLRDKAAEKTGKQGQRSGPRRVETPQGPDRIEGIDQGQHRPGIDQRDHQLRDLGPPLP